MSDITNDVAKCIMILRTAKNDNEKLAGLFMVAKAVDEKNCNTTSRIALFKAIGYDFFTKLLTATDVPNDCSSFVYKSLAVTVLGCFCHDPELATHPDMLVHIPSILSLFKDFVEMSDECNFQDCHTLLQLIASHDKGQKALVNAKAVHKLGMLYTHHSFKEINVLQLFIILLDVDCIKFCKYDYHQLIHKVLNKLSEKFVSEQTQLKFNIIPELWSLISVSNNYIVIDTSSKHNWPQNIFLGVKDILSSKIHKSHRDPAFRLVSMVINMLGIKWTMRDENEPKKYFLLFVHLSAIEVRMQMEDRTFKEAFAEMELITSCFAILEAAIYFMASDELILQQNDILTVYTSLKNAFNAVLEVLIEVSHYTESLNNEEKMFINAIVKVLIAWLTQETTSSQTQIYHVLPFMLSVANETFEQSKLDQNKGDLLRLMLPVLCQFIVDDKGREIIVATEIDVLCECIFYHWQRFYSNSRKVPFGRNESVPMERSRSAIVYLCDIFSNIALLNSSQSLNNNTFNSLLEFIILNVSDINNSDINISIDGSLAVLGLIILKQLPDKLVDNFEVRHLLNIVFSFLSSAYQIDDDSRTIALNPRILDAFEDEWPHVMDFWYLGFETLSSLFALNSWVVTIAAENAWLEKIIQMFVKVRPEYFPSNIKTTFENFLCSSVNGHDENISTLKKYNVVKICKEHNLSELKMKINH